MKNMRKVWMALCMMVCLFALAGCSNETTVTTDPSIDAQTVANVQAMADQHMMAFATITDAELYEQLLYAEENKIGALEAASISWMRAESEAGAYVSHSPAAVIKGYESYIAVINAVFETRNVKMTVQIKDNLKETTSITFVPQYTTGEKLAQAGIDTSVLVGAAAVAAVLLLGLLKAIADIAAVKKQLAGGTAAPAASAPAEKPAAPAAPAPVAYAPAEPNYMDDAELVAVIAAAIAASEGRTSTNGLNVRSIKRVPNRNWK